MEISGKIYKNKVLCFNTKDADWDGFLAVDEEQAKEHEKEGYPIIRGKNEIEIVTKFSVPAKKCFEVRKNYIHNKLWYKLWLDAKKVIKGNYIAAEKAEKQAELYKKLYFDCKKQFAELRKNNIHKSKIKEAIDKAEKTIIDNEGFGIDRTVFYAIKEFSKKLKKKLGLK